MKKSYTKYQFKHLQNRYIRITAAIRTIGAFTLLIFFHSYKLHAQDPGKGGTQAGFEIDANFKSGIIPSFWVGSGANQNYFPNTTTFGADWSGAAAVLKQIGGVSVDGSSADGRAVWHVDGNWGTNSAVAEVVSFAGNSNKNGDNIAAGQHPYSLQLGGTGPQKNDITNTYLYSKRVIVGSVPHTWLFFAAETRATNGNSYIDFEYNQAGVTVTNTQLTGKGPVGGRSVGDFILVVNYTGGGNRPIIGIRKWQASGTWSAELPVNSTQFITTNSAAVDPVAPNKAFTTDGAFANTVIPLQLMEGGVDITALNIAELNLCNTNATVTIKTRSSSSFTAELKDLDVVPFTLLPPAGLTDLTNVTKCPGTMETASFTTTVSGDGALGSNVEWYKGNIKLTTGGKYTISSTATTSTLTITGIVEADEGTYKAKLVNASCGTPEETATLTVNPVPEANAGATPASQCFSASGNTFSLNGSGANGNPSWAIAPNGNPGSFTVQITNGSTYTPTVKVTTGVNGGSVTLRLTVTSNQTPSCGNKTSDVTVTILPQAAGPQVTYIAPTCLETTFKVTVDNPVSGSTYTLRQLTGGISPVTKKAPDDVVDGKITFAGLTVGKGYRVTATNGAGCVSAPNSCGDFSAIPAGTASANTGEVQYQEITLKKSYLPKVLAAPNPFNDRIRFSLKSEVSGQGALELYNMLGQKVKTVFQGQVNAGQVQTIEYAVPVQQRANLIYVFRVGDQSATGKLIGLKQ